MEEGLLLTKRQYLTRLVLIDSVRAGTPIDVWTAIEAVSSTAIEHPEWDLDEEHTWEEWESM